MKMIRELLISLMFAGLIVSGIIEFLRFEIMHAAIGLGLLGSCGILMKVNMVCNHYLQVHRSDEHDR